MVQHKFINVKTENEIEQISITENSLSKIIKKLQENKNDFKLKLFKSYLNDNNYRVSINFTENYDFFCLPFNDKTYLKKENIIYGNKDSIIAYFHEDVLKLMLIQNFKFGKPIIRYIEKAIPKKIDQFYRYFHKLASEGDYSALNILLQNKEFYFWNKKLIDMLSIKHVNDVDIFKRSALVKLSVNNDYKTFDIFVNHQGSERLSNLLLKGGSFNFINNCKNKYSLELSNNKIEKTDSVEDTLKEELNKYKVNEYDSLFLFSHSFNSFSVKSYINGDFNISKCRLSHLIDLNKKLVREV